MEETQKQKLDPRIKNVWRVSDTIALTLIFLCVFAVGGIALLVDESTSWWAGPYCLISFICFVALLILFWVVITPLRYIRWSYALSKEFLDIMRGIIVAQAHRSAVHSRAEHRHAPRSASAHDGACVGHDLDRSWIDGDPRASRC